MYSEVSITTAFNRDINGIVSLFGFYIRVKLYTITVKIPDDILHKLRHPKSPVAGSEVTDKCGYSVVFCQLSVAYQQNVGIKRLK